MADRLTAVAGVVNRFLQDPQSSRAALAFVAGMPFGAKAKGKRA
jgi:HTH-type transcriptional regulator, glycine betaine synthesis regulator